MFNPLDPYQEPQQPQEPEEPSYAKVGKMEFGPVGQHIIKTAKKWKVDPAVALAIARQESGFDNSRVSPAGARGIMQLMPDTAARMGVDPDDWQQNIEGGMKYLSELIDQYPDVESVLRTYNSGKPRGKGGAETAAYVPSVSKWMEYYRANMAGEDAVVPQQVKQQQQQGKRIGRTQQQSLPDQGLWQKFEAAKANEIAQGGYKQMMEQGSAAGYAQQLRAKGWEVGADEHGNPYVQPPKRTNLRFTQGPKFEEVQATMQDFQRYPETGISYEAMNQGNTPEQQQEVDTYRNIQRAPGVTGTLLRAITNPTLARFLGRATESTGKAISGIGEIASRLPSFGVQSVAEDRSIQEAGQGVQEFGRRIVGTFAPKMGPPNVFERTAEAAGSMTPNLAAMALVGPAAAPGVMAAEAGLERLGETGSVKEGLKQALVMRLGLAAGSKLMAPMQRGLVGATGRVAGATGARIASGAGGQFVSGTAANVLGPALGHSTLNAVTTGGAGLAKAMSFNSPNRGAPERLEGNEADPNRVENINFDLGNRFRSIFEPFTPHALAEALPLAVGFTAHGMLKHRNPYDTLTRTGAEPPVPPIGPPPIDPGAIVGAPQAVVSPMPLGLRKPPGLGPVAPVKPFGKPGDINNQFSGEINSISGAPMPPPTINRGYGIRPETIIPQPDGTPQPPVPPGSTTYQNMGGLPPTLQQRITQAAAPAAPVAAGKPIPPKTVVETATPTPTVTPAAEPIQIGKRYSHPKSYGGEPVTVTRIAGATIFGTKPDGTTVSWGINTPVGKGMRPFVESQPGETNVTPVTPPSPPVTIVPPKQPRVKKTKAEAKIAEAQTKALTPEELAASIKAALGLGETAPTAPLSEEALKAQVAASLGLTDTTGAGKPPLKSPKAIMESWKAQDKENKLAAGRERYRDMVARNLPDSDFKSLFAAKTKLKKGETWEEKARQLFGNAPGPGREAAPNKPLKQRITETVVPQETHPEPLSEAALKAQVAKSLGLGDTPSVPAEPPKPRLVKKAQSEVALETPGEIVSESNELPSRARMLLRDIDSWLSQYRRYDAAKTLATLRKDFGDHPEFDQAAEKIERHPAKPPQSEVAVPASLETRLATPPAEGKSIDAMTKAELEAVTRDPKEVGKKTDRWYDAKARLDAIAMGDEAGFIRSDLLGSDAIAKALDKSRKTAGKFIDFIAKMETPEGKIAAGIDPSLMKTMARNLYSGDIGTITVKELIQNSVDSMRGLTDRSKGKLSVDIDGNTVKMTDNGVGMLPEVVKKQLVDLGSSLKSEGSSGGFGVAKAAIFANADNIFVDTVARNAEGQLIRTKLTGTSEDWISPERGLSIESTIAPEGTPTGTEMKIRLNPDVKFSSWTTAQFLERFRKHSNLFHGMEVTVNGQLREAPAALTQTFLDKVEIPGGEYNVNAVGEVKERASMDIYYLNNGLYQYTGSFYMMGSAKLPRGIIVDVQSKLPVQDANYPWMLNREGVRDTVTKSVNDFINKTLVAPGQSKLLDDYRNAIASAPVIGKTGTQLLESAGQFTHAEKVALAAMPHTQAIAEATRKAFEIIDKELQLESDIYQNQEFRGLGTNTDWLGVSVQFPGLAEGKALIYANPWRHALAVSLRVESGTLARSQAADVMAKRMAATLVHEATHTEQRTHGESFSLELTWNIGRLINRIEAAHAPLLKAFSKGNTYAETVEQAKRFAADNWNREKRDILESITAESSAGKDGFTSSESDPEARTGERDRPTESVPRSGRGSGSLLSRLSGTGAPRSDASTGGAGRGERLDWTRDRAGLFNITASKEGVQGKSDYGLSEREVRAKYPEQAERIITEARTKDTGSLTREGFVRDLNIEAENTAQHNTSLRQRLDGMSKRGTGEEGSIKSDLLGSDKLARKLTNWSKEFGSREERLALLNRKDEGDTNFESERTDDLQRGRTGEEGFIRPGVLFPQVAAMTKKLVDAIPELKFTKGAKAVARGLRGLYDPAMGDPRGKETERSVEEHYAQRNINDQRAELHLRHLDKMFTETVLPTTAYTPEVQALVAGGKLKPKHAFATDFKYRMQKGLPQANAALTAIAKDLRTELDKMRTQIQGLGINALITYDRNYFPQLHKDPQRALNFLEETHANKPLAGNVGGGLKQKTYLDVVDAANAGLEPMFSNPIQDALLRITQAHHFIAGQRIAKEVMDPRMGGRWVAERAKLPDGYSYIKDSIFKRFIQPIVPGEVRTAMKFIAPTPVANVINVDLARGLSWVPGFQGARAVANSMNNMSLGWSPFHANFIAQESLSTKGALAVEQAAMGDFATAAKTMSQIPTAVHGYYKSGKEVLNAAMNPGKDPHLDKIIDALVAGGFHFGIPSEHMTQFRKQLGDAWRNGIMEAKLGDPSKLVFSLPALGAKIPFAITEWASGPLMEKLVPTTKAGVAMELMRHELQKLGPDYTRDQLRQVARKVTASVDNRFGQLAYDNLHWNKAMKDIIQLVIRAPGWNIGTIREVGGGIMDMTHLATAGAAGLVAKGLGGKTPAALQRFADTKPELGHRAPYVISLLPTAAVLGVLTQAALTGWHTGTPELPKDWKDYYMPRSGRFDENGRAERYSVPSYTKDLMEYMVDIQESIIPWHMAANKVGPFGHTIAEQITNSDWRGTAVTDYSLNPFDSKFKPLQALAERGENVATHYLPFSFSGFFRERQREGAETDTLGKMIRDPEKALNETSLSQVLPLAGIARAPSMITNTPAQHLLQEYIDGQRKSEPQTRDNAERNQFIARAANLIKQGKEAQIGPEIERRITAGTLRLPDIKAIRDRATALYPMQHSFRSLDSFDKAVEVYRKANPEERLLFQKDFIKKATLEAEKWGAPEKTEAIVRTLTELGVGQE